jgi:hypothetical protein
MSPTPLEFDFLPSHPHVSSEVEKLILVVVGYHAILLGLLARFLNLASFSSSSRISWVG